jgi:hypothetical protein
MSDMGESIAGHDYPDLWVCPKVISLVCPNQGYTEVGWEE